MGYILQKCQYTLMMIDDASPVSIVRPMQAHPIPSKRFPQTPTSLPAVSMSSVVVSFFRSFSPHLIHGPGQANTQPPPNPARPRPSPRQQPHRACTAPPSPPPAPRPTTRQSPPRRRPRPAPTRGQAVNARRSCSSSAAACSCASAPARSCRSYPSPCGLARAPARRPPST